MVLLLIHEDDLEEMDLKCQLVLLSMRTRRNWNQDGSRRTVNVEDTSSNAMVAIDGAGFDWSFNADDEVPTNMALMAFLESESEFNLATYKRELAYVEKQLIFYKKNEVLFCEQIAVLKRDMSYKDSEISVLKRSQIPDNIKKDLDYESYHAVPPHPTGLFLPPKLDLSNYGLEEFQQPEFKGYGPNTSKNAIEDIPNELKKYPDAPLVKDMLSNNKNCSVESLVVVGKKTVVHNIAKVKVVRLKQ
nr:hypothetical protein [Tanacetum cinerariifolium]